MFLDHVVSYSISTSNHNLAEVEINIEELYLIPFLHQTTTDSTSVLCENSCILFHFYIKPQLYVYVCARVSRCILFHFYIKPQHKPNVKFIFSCCILFHFYIKPQHECAPFAEIEGCILFHFYIKPQLIMASLFSLPVVSYSISTSNHNYATLLIKNRCVVSYSISTSNHN